MIGRWFAKRRVKKQIELDPTLLDKTDKEIWESRRWTDAEKKVVLEIKSKI